VPLALATLKTLLKEDYISQVAEKEALFRSLLKHPKIIEIRSAGLMMGVQMESFDFIQKVIGYCLEKGLITDWFLFNSETLRIAPPLIISEEEIRWACKIILESIEEATLEN
jgi:acetylornithine/succinyldiaminopimelate/putrescine aminotransferase